MDTVVVKTALALGRKAGSRQIRRVENTVCWRDQNKCTCKWTAGSLEARKLLGWLKSSSNQAVITCSVHLSWGDIPGTETGHLFQSLDLLQTMPNLPNFPTLPCLAIHPSIDTFSFRSIQLLSRYLLNSSRVPETGLHTGAQINKMGHCPWYPAGWETNTCRWEALGVLWTYLQCIVGERRETGSLLPEREWGGGRLGNSSSKSCFGLEVVTALQGTRHIPDLIHCIQSGKQSCFPYYQTTTGYLSCARHCAGKYGFGNLQSSLVADI